MAVESYAQISTPPEFPPATTLIGLEPGQRYLPMSYDDLLASGVMNDMGLRGTMSTTDVTLNLVLVYGLEYEGPLVQVCMSNGERGTFTADIYAESLLLIASNQTGTTETRLSLADSFTNAWNSQLDSLLAGGPVSRVGGPGFTWRMFPTGYLYGDEYLQSDQTYVEIQQEILIDPGWYWSDYHAQITYWIELFVANGQVNAFVAAWYLLVDPGEKHTEITNLLKPQVSGAMTQLQSFFNSQLAKTAALNPTDVYLLPATQVKPLGTGPALVANTLDDVTVVVVS
jgi:hypothetical protein